MSPVPICDRFVEHSVISFLKTVSDKTVIVFSLSVLQRVETLVAPSDGAPLVSLAFPTPDVTPTVLDIKEYYRELAENLQVREVGGGLILF